MKGSYMLFYNEEGEHQVINAQTVGLGRSLVGIKKPVQHYTFQKPPCPLTVASYLQAGDDSLAEAAILAYDDTDEELSPVQRAREAFKVGFGRAAKTSKQPHEARALADIVAKNLLLHVEERVKEEANGDTDTAVLLDRDDSGSVDAGGGDEADIKLTIVTGGDDAGADGGTPDGPGVEL